MNDAGGVDAAYRAVDKARRRLGISAERFRGLLLEQISDAGAEAPKTASGSLKALVTAYCEDGRGEEIAATAKAFARRHSLAHDIT